MSLPEKLLRAIKLVNKYNALMQEFNDLSTKMAPEVARLKAIHKDCMDTKAELLNHSSMFAGTPYDFSIEQVDVTKEVQQGQDLIDEINSDLSNDL